MNQNVVNAGVRLLYPVSVTHEEELKGYRGFETIVPMVRRSQRVM